MKLQDAFASETNGLGTWANIGYKMESTNANFIYGGGDVTAVGKCPTIEGKSVTENSAKTGCQYTEDSKTTQVSYLSSSLTAGWTAESAANLNDCAKGKNWIINSTIGDSENTGAVTYTAGATLSTGCETLTPKFYSIAAKPSNG